MAYEKHVWQTNEIITAEKLNHIEDALEGSSTATAATIPTFDYIHINDIEMEGESAEGQVIPVYWDIYDDTLNYQHLAELYDTHSHVRCNIQSSNISSLRITYTLQRISSNEIHLIAVFPSQTEELIFRQDAAQPRGNIYSPQGVLLHNIICTYQQRQDS